MKQYLLTRFKKRWPTIPAAGIFGVFAVLRRLHEGKAIGDVFGLCVGFTVFVLLFPLRFGGDDWNE